MLKMVYGKIFQFAKSENLCKYEWFVGWVVLCVLWENKHSACFSMLAAAFKWVCDGAGGTQEYQNIIEFEVEFQF